MYMVGKFRDSSHLSASDHGRLPIMERPREWNEAGVVVRLPSFEAFVLVGEIAPGEFELVHGPTRPIYPRPPRRPPALRGDGLSMNSGRMPT